MFIEDFTGTQPEYVYWGRLMSHVDPATRTVSFIVYSQTDPLKLKKMIEEGNRFPYPGGIAVGGETVLTIHLKDSQNPGAKRYASRIVHHGGGSGGQQSALGIAWDIRESPPRADADDDLLPWN